MVISFASLCYCILTVVFQCFWSFKFSVLLMMYHHYVTLELFPGIWMLPPSSVIFHSYWRQFSYTLLAYSVVSHFFSFLFLYYRCLFFYVCIHFFGNISQRLHCYTSSSSSIINFTSKCFKQNTCTLQLYFCRFLCILGYKIYYLFLSIY